MKEESVKPALVWMSEHQRDCSVGDHEAVQLPSRGQMKDAFRSLDDPLIEQDGIKVFVCRHCRNLFVEKH